MNTNLAIKEVEFNGSQLMAAQDNKTKKIYVGVKWICNGLGLSKGQMQSERIKIHNDLVLSKGELNLVLPTNGGNQETLVLELDFLPLWLAKISITPTMQKTNPQLVERLVEYQLKAKDVLAEAFIDNQFRHKDLPFGFDFMKSLMEQTVTLNNRLLDTIVGTEVDIARLNNSIIDLAKYIKLKDNQQLSSGDNKQNQKSVVHKAKTQTLNPLIIKNYRSDICKTIIKICKSTNAGNISNIYNLCFAEFEKQTNVNVLDELRILQVLLLTYRKAVAGSVNCYQQPHLENRIKMIAKTRTIVATAQNPNPNRKAHSLLTQR